MIMLRIVDPSTLRVLVDHFGGDHDRIMKAVAEAAEQGRLSLIKVSVRGDVVEPTHDSVMLWLTELNRVPPQPEYELTERPGTLWAALEVKYGPQVRAAGRATRPIVETLARCAGVTERAAAEHARKWCKARRM